MPKSVTIIGAGRIGRTLGAIITADNRDVACRFWDVRPDARTPGFRSLAEITADTDIILFAVPSIALPALIDELQNLRPATILVTISKGAPQPDIISPAELFSQRLPRQPLVVIGGPMMAEEMSVEHPGEAVVATTTPTAGQAVLELLNHAHIVTFANDRPIDTSRCGVLKNIAACTVGMIDGGDLTSELHHQGHKLIEAEFLQAGQALGIHDSILRGPAGLGDFSTTIHSPHSRNRRAGEELVRNNVRDMTAESLHSFPPLMNALRDTPTPLFRTAADIIAGTTSSSTLYQLISTL